MENVGSMSFLIRPQSVVCLPYGQDTACCSAVRNSRKPWMQEVTPALFGEVLQQQLTTSAFLRLSWKQNLWDLFSFFFSPTIKYLNCTGA